MSAVSERRETISTYLEPADAALLRSRARAAERSIAAEIRVALRDHLNGVGVGALAGRRDATDRALARGE